MVNEKLNPIKYYVALSDEVRSVFQKVGQADYTTFMSQVQNSIIEFCSYPLGNHPYYDSWWLTSEIFASACTLMNCSGSPYSEDFSDEFMLDLVITLSVFWLPDTTSFCVVLEKIPPELVPEDNLKTLYVSYSSSILHTAH